MGGAGQLDLDLVYRPYRVVRSKLAPPTLARCDGTNLYMFKFNYQQASIGVNAGITTCTRKPGSED